MPETTSRHAVASRGQLPAGSPVAAADAQPQPPVRGPLPAPTDDQPTVISAPPPSQAPLGASDSARRILRGEIAPGDRLGHFDLIEYVGGGGMGRVYRAVDSKLARTVALKVLSPEQAADPETLARFQNEAQSAARLDHPNIARVYHVGEDRGLHYIVFEFIEGTNVRALVERKGPLAPVEAISYTLQVADALAHAAERRVVHRDIKPSNLLITPEGRVKLIDMGLARLRHMDSAAAELTASGVTLGTFDYISPEQARDPRNADVRSDIYSLGCTFFYMLVGRPPFPEGTVLQKLLQHQADEPPDLRALRPDASPELAQVLRKMLAKDPRARYQDPEQLIDELTAVARRSGLEPRGGVRRAWLAPPAPGGSPVWNHLPWIAPLVVLVAVFLLTNYIWSTQAQRDAVAPAPVGEAGAVPGEGGDDSAGDSAVERAAANLDEPSGGSGEKAPGAERPGQQPRASGIEPPTPSAPVEPGSGGPSEPSRPPGAANAPEQRRGPSLGLFGVDAALGPPRPATASTGILGGGVPGWPIASAASGFDRPGWAVLPPSGGWEGEEDGLPLATTVAGLGASVGAGADGASGAARPSAQSAPPGAETAPNPSALAGAGLLVVDGKGDTAGHFQSLGAALRVAADGDTIELAFDGAVEEKPIALGRQALTIRAARGYQPVVAFRPADTDPVKHPRSMFGVAAGDVKWIEVGIELTLPRGAPADHWSLFEIRGPSAIAFDRCRLTLRNTAEGVAAYHPDVAFFRVAAAPNGPTGSAGGNGPSPRAALPSGNVGSAAVVTLVDSILRGEASVVVADGVQPARWSCSGGFVAAGQPAFVLPSAAASRGDQGSPNDIEPLLAVELRRATVVAPAGLCHAWAATAASPIARIECSESVLIGSPETPLIVQVGGSIDPLRAPWTYRGWRNWYEQVLVFWEMRSPQGAVVDRIGFDDWCRYWGKHGEVEPRWNQLRWKSPPPSTALHAQVPDDYQVLAAGDEPSGGSSEAGASSSEPASPEPAGSGDRVVAPLDEPAMAAPPAEPKAP